MTDTIATHTDTTAASSIPDEVQSITRTIRWLIKAQDIYCLGRNRKDSPTEEIDVPISDAHTAKIAPLFTHKVFGLLKGAREPLLNNRL